MSLRWQTALMVLVVFTFAIGMVAFLNYSKFRSSLEDAVESRIMFVGDNISDSLEQTLALGSSISAAQTVSGLMELEKKNDSIILSIDVADDTGTVLFSTDQRRIGSKVASYSSSDLDGDHWRLVGTNAVSLLIPVRNTFDLQVGVVVLRYSLPYLDGSAFGFLQKIGVASGALLIGAVVPITLLLWWVLAAMRRTFLAIETPLQALASGQEADESGEIGPFASSVRQVELELQDIEQMAEAQPARS